MTRALVLTAALLLALAPPALADLAPVDCEALAARAGAEVGIPEGVLPAIARVESARNGRAWPWTLNQGGKGSYHPSKEAALAHLAKVLASGARNVDLGCMQLNWRWHSKGFPDAAAMMDPVQNTRYAARFLRSLRDRFGSWDRAVQAYHSMDPARGAAYAARVHRARARLGDTRMAAAALPDASLPPMAVAADAPLPQPVLRGILVMASAPLVQRGPGADLRLARAPGFWPRPLSGGS